MTQNSVPKPAAAPSRPSRLQRVFKENGWLFIAVTTYLITLYLTQAHPEWPPIFRVALTLLPLLPGVVYLRHLWLAFKSLDELQQRIQVEAWGFAATGTIIVGTALNVLNAHGLGLENYPHGLEIGGVYLTMFILWSIGTAAASARYR